MQFFIRSVRQKFLACLWLSFWLYFFPYEEPWRPLIFCGYKDWSISCPGLFQEIQMAALIRNHHVSGFHSPCSNCQFLFPLLLLALQWRPASQLGQVEYDWVLIIFNQFQSAITHWVFPQVLDIENIVWYTIPGSLFGDIGASRSVVTGSATFVFLWEDNWGYWENKHILFCYICHFFGTTGSPDVHLHSAIYLEDFFPEILDYS